MGELILCRQSIAANPYFIEDSALNIYSLEELSYYIAHNVYLMNAEFASKELCRWIGAELGVHELEKQLLDTLAQRAPLHVFIGQILTYDGYLTNPEIREILAQIASFENKSPMECQKLRADRLMDKRRITDAIFEYEKILDDEKVKKAPSTFVGDVWHNLGTAYAQLFFFGEASLCFEEAYQHNHRAQSLRSMLSALRCNRDEKRFDELVERYFIPPDLVEDIKAEATALSREDKVREFDVKIGGLMEARDASDAALGEILQQWKAEYNRLCSM